MRRLHTYTPFIALLLLSGIQSALAQNVGKVIAVTGSVQASRIASGEREKLDFNSPIFLNDRIHTGEQGQTKILLIDDSILKVSPLSQLDVTEQVAGVAQERTTINLLKGRLRTVIGRKLNLDARFEVHTPVAIAGVRGTDFEVWQYSPDDAAIRCYEGLIEVRSSIPGVEGSVLIGPNSFTRVTRGMPPEPPMFIAPDEFLGDRLGMVVGQKDLWGDPVTIMARTLLLEQEKLFHQTEEFLLLRTRPIDFSEGSPAGEFIFETLDMEQRFAPIESEEMTMKAERVLYEQLYEQLYGDTLDQQVDTFTEAGSGGANLQLDIIIPTP